MGDRRQESGESPSEHVAAQLVSTIDPIFNDGQDRGLSHNQSEDSVENHHDYPRLDLDRDVGHSASPNSYEFALHGLLALGSVAQSQNSSGFITSPPSQDLQALKRTHDVSTDPEPPMPDSQRAQVEGLGQPWPSASPAEGPPGADMSLEIDIGHGSYLSTMENNFDINTQNQTIAGSTERANVQPSPASDIITPRWGINVESTSRDSAMEMMRYYRYHIAPWVSMSSERLLSS